MSQPNNRESGHRAALTQGLLLEDEEDGVNELDVFDVVVDHVESDESLCGSALPPPVARLAYWCKGRVVANGEIGAVLEPNGETKWSASNKRAMVI